ncbi:MAG TPA: TatD family hydrolase [Kiritimatiellia bacterium]|nr:TatD family hydrolase [Kiritimatiellia bacterium]HPR68869.1 TatD family hydrolase [Kiritimatiellia bacterium]
MTIAPSLPPDTQKLQWADAHSHLQDPRLAPRLDDVLARARAAGFVLLHAAATSEGDWPAVAALADAHPGLVIASFGLHPWFIQEKSSAWLRTLRALLADRPAGIGEIGLDGRMNDGLDADREAVFLAQLDLSCELALPASVHCRDAWGRMLDLLLHRPPHPAGLLIHAYSGPPDALPALAEKNVFISFGGTLTRPRNARARQNARQVAAGRFLLESDAPDLPPDLPDHLEPFLTGPDGKLLSEPACIPYAGQILADVRGESLAGIAAQTTATARRLFAPLIT